VAEVEQAMPRCLVTRRVHFNAAHRLFNPRFSDAENERVFGVCNNPNFHGHNYNLDVSVEGEIDAATGYVLDINRLKEITEESLVRHLDHKNLNLDVSWFAGLIPTAENIAVVCWRVLEPALKPARLAHIRLWETERNYVDYTGT
jgi:6-pyruvoyltetrahydropterin/6-carboxytetrahydropterin synthase